MSKKDSKKVYCYKKNTKQLVNIFNSTGEASRNTGIDQSNISKCCRREIKSIGNYIFSYVELRLNNNNNNTTGVRDIDRLYNVWIDKIYDQKILLLNKENDKDVIEYLNSLNQFENKLEVIYHSVEDVDLCYQMLSELKYEFMTYYDFREVILKVETMVENTDKKNQYLLVDKDF